MTLAIASRMLFGLTGTLTQFYEAHKWREVINVLRLSVVAGEGEKPEISSGGEQQQRRKIMQIQFYEPTLSIFRGRQIADQQTRNHFLSFEKSFAKESTSFKSLTASHRPVAGVLLFGKRLRRSIPRTGLPDRSMPKSTEEAEAATRAIPMPRMALQLRHRADAAKA
ncbi:MAG: hypothetical protein AAB401_15400 [Acidobacteriota bacterium]